MDGKLLCLITGASGGFGKEIAICMAKHAGDTSNHVEKCTMILSGRNEERLDATKSAVMALNPLCKVVTIAMDQMKKQSCEKGMKDICTMIETDDFTCGVLFNNASCLGDVSLKVDEIADWTLLASHFNTNITSQFYITSLFIAAVKQKKMKAMLINSSSLLAIKPASYTSLYCTSKAAIDMLYNVIAEENQNKELSIKTLNYGPGPMETEMQATLETNSKCEAIVNYQKGLREKGELVKPDHSAQKLFRLLLQNTFISGSHVDFYEIE